MTAVARRLILAAAAGLLAGCAGPAHHSQSARTPTSGVYQPRNYVGESILPRSVRRVILLPVDGGQFADAETCEYLDRIFANALEHQLRFEVVPLSREECAQSFGSPSVASTDALPHDFLQGLGTKYAAQAVMFVDITAFEAYRPLGIGIRAKLATVADRRLIWSFDETFSCLDPTVVNGLRHYYAQGTQKGSPIDMSSDALDSPRQFAAYAANATFGTLPRR